MNDDETKTILREIRDSLRTISAWCESRPAEPHLPPRPHRGGDRIGKNASRGHLETGRQHGKKIGAQAVLAKYCDAYKARYGIFPIIDGKAAGLAASLCRAVPVERLGSLLEAYVQMDDAWFKTRCHDFSTFSANIGKVAVALANGTQDPHEREYWRKVFGDGEGNVRGTITTNEGNLGRAALPGGASGDVLEEPAACV